MWELFVNLRRSLLSSRSIRSNVHRLKSAIWGHNGTLSTFRFRVRPLNCHGRGGAKNTDIFSPSSTARSLSRTQRRISPLCPRRKPFNPPNHLPPTPPDRNCLTWSIRISSRKSCLFSDAYIFNITNRVRYILNASYGFNFEGIIMS